MVTSIVNGLQRGQIDRALFTADANFYFNAQTTDDFRTSLAPLGRLLDAAKANEALRGGMTYRGYTLHFAKGRATLSTYTMADGKIEQFLIEPAE